MKLRFAPRAIENLTAIGDYLHVRDPAASIRVRGSIIESVQILLLFPRAGRRQNLEGVRRMVTRRYRYLIYYTVDEVADELVVVAVKHPAQERKQEDR